MAAPPLQQQPPPQQQQQQQAALGSGVGAGVVESEKQRRQRFLDAMEEYDKKVSARSAANGGAVVGAGRGGGGGGEGRGGGVGDAGGVGETSVTSGDTVSAGVKKERAEGAVGVRDALQAEKAKGGPQDCPVM